VKPAALVYLRDNVAAQRLAIAWPLVTDRARTENVVVREWARIADVPPHVAEGLAAVLRAHGICRDDGTIDPLAEQYIGAQVQSTIRVPRAQGTRR